MHLPTNIQLIEHNETNACYKFTLTNDLFYFQGHFTEFKILAGVIELKYALYFASQYFNVNLKCKEIKKIKFSQPILANDTVHLYLDYQKDQKILTFSYKKVCDNDLKEACLASIVVW